MGLNVEDFETTGHGYELYTTPESYNEVKEALAERQIPVAAGELAMIPQTQVPLTADKLPKVLRFMEAMEDLDDVQNVWANFDADEEALAAADAGG